MDWLNYHHLFYFWVTAKEGSINNASKKLGIGQPTISTLIKTLEETLGHSLFDRKNRVLVLTEGGKVVFDYASQIFALGNELLEVVKDGTFSQRVHVQFGVLDSVPKGLVQSLILSAQKTGPCVISILEGDEEHLFRELQAHRVDLVVSNFPPSIGDKKQFFSRFLAKHSVAVYGAKKFQSLKRKFPSSLQGQPFIMPSLHSKFRHDLNHFFKTINVNVDTIIETQDTSIQKLLGVQGMGLVPLPEFACTELIKEKKLFKLGTLEKVTEDFWLVSSPRKFQNPIARDLMENFNWEKK
ncbi:MAG: LysR family transcriptional regulator [Nitrospinae bacterium]|nr:LysR family transcriptional regulator [Nitrospinota bacterium]